MELKWIIIIILLLEVGILALSFAGTPNSLFGEARDFDETTGGENNPTLIHSRQKVHVYDSAAQTIAHNTNVDFRFDTILYDENGMFKSADETHLYIKEDGYYYINCQIRFVSNATGYRQIRIRIDPADGGADYKVGDNAESAFTGAMWTATNVVAYLKAGDKIYFNIVQTSGGDLNTWAGQADSFAEIIGI